MAKTAYSGTFEITAPASLTVTAPNSGTFNVGDTVTITWSTTGTVGNVRIQLYNTANQNVGTIVSSTSNDGSYNWTIAGSMIAQHETEYQLKVFQVSGSSPVDYSGNLEIYPYTNKTAGDDLSVDQSVSTALGQWKFVNTIADALSIGQSVTVPTPTSWKHIKTAGDDLNLTDSFSSVKDSWFHKLSAGDDLGIAQSVSTPVTQWPKQTLADDLNITHTFTTVIDVWFHKPSLGDVLGISQSVSTPVTSWPKQTLNDTLNLISSPITVVRDWIHIHALAESLGVSQAVTTVKDIWFHKFTLVDDLSVAQSVTQAVTQWPKQTLSDDTSILHAFSSAIRVWRPPRTATDDLSIVQSFTSLVDVWFHRLTHSDDLDLSQSVSDVKSSWRTVFYFDNITESLQMSQQFSYGVNTFVTDLTASDELNMSDTFYFTVTKVFGVMYFQHDNTLISLGHANRTPISQPIYPKQLTKVAGSGASKVTDFADALEFIDVKVEIDQLTRTSLYDFFNTNVKWGANDFIFTDANNTDYTVRLWNSNGFNLPIKQGGMVDVGLRLRKQIN